MIAVVIEYLIILCGNVSGTCVIVFLIGAYIMLTSLIKDIARSIRSANESIRNEDSRSKIVSMFSNCIGLHSDTLQLEFSLL